MYSYRHKSSDEKPNRTVNFMRKRAKFLRSIITDIGGARGAVYNSIFYPLITPPAPVTFSRGGQATFLTGAEEDIEGGGETEER